MATRKMTLPTLMVDFDTDAECRALLERLRWPDGVCCLRCGSERISRITTRIEGPQILPVELGVFEERILPDQVADSVFPGPDLSALGQESLRDRDAQMVIEADGLDEGRDRIVVELDVSELDGVVDSHEVGDGEEACEFLCV